MKRYILTGIILMAALCLSAQTVDTAHFRLQYTPKLTPSKKLNQQPSLKDTVTEKVHFSYYIVPERFDATFQPTPIKYNKVSPEGLDKMYRNFLKVGFGYPITPLLDFSFHNLQNQKNSFGANVHHFSSWAPQIGKVMKQYEYYPTSDTRVHLNYKHFFKHYTLYSAIDYNHEAARFYGFKKESTDFHPDYIPEKRDLKNNFHHLSATAGFASNFVLEEKKPKFDIGLDYDMLRTNWKDMENHVGLKSFVGYDARWAKISGSQLYRLNLNLDYYNEKWPLFTGNALLFNPEAFAQFSIKEYHIIVGVGGVVDANNLTVDNKFKTSDASTIYPIAELNLGLIPSILSIYAGVNDGAHFNSLESLLYENPFVKPHLNELRTTTDRINIYGGVKGNLVKNLNYNISARYSFSKNMAIFVIDTTDHLFNKFNVEYYRGNRLNICLNLDYEILRNLHINFEANYWVHALSDTMPNGEKRVALHKPALEFAFNGKYVLKEKFVFDLNFNLAFGRKALVPVAHYDGNNQFVKYHYSIEKMRPILDFGIGFEYLINDHFSAFASINNLACQYYAKYYDFKSMGINALVGVTYSFGHESIKKAKSKK